MEREKLISLVRGVQSGDDNAMTQMYTAFYDDLYYYIYKSVNDSQLAEDLTQDTFMEILQSIQSLQEPAAFVTWSRQIAYRRCTAYFKKRHDLLVDEDEDGYSVFDTVAEDRAEFIPDEALDKEELKKAIHGIIDELPEEQRAAIMMRYFDEISVADIAKIQGVSEGTVKSRLNYGRKAIKQSVETYEKKNNVKLRCAGVIPLLLWLVREYRVANGLSLTTGAAAGTAGAATAATSASAGTAAVLTAKTVSTALTAKIAAGVVAAAVAVGGIALATKSGEDCKHQWQANSTGGSCVLCQAVCDHKESLSVEISQETPGLLCAKSQCENCGWQGECYTLEHTKDPIRITKPTDLIFKNITEESHDRTINLLKDTWKVADDPNVTVRCIGALYYYDEEWVEDSKCNNRLILFYHLDNGVVPGGWYTYLGPNGNVVIKCTGTPEAPEFSTINEAEINWGDHMSFLWIEGLKEYYSFWLDTNYPVSFKYNDVRYMGHTTVEDCLVALQKNSFAEFELQFDHVIAYGEMKNYVTEK